MNALRKLLSGYRPRCRLVVTKPTPSSLSHTIDSGAAILISGDSDLKGVRAYKGVEILSPAQFFERFKTW